MSIQPLGDRVLVKVSESESKTKGGLYIPDNAKEKTTQGTVIAIGSHEDIKVKAGDKVLYDKYAGSGITIDDAEHILLRNEDILATIS
ncbi:MAG: co-chaperone GroES [Spirochaetota bacterium]|jgi:chaperonin GroES|nr:co-chaperone GroES [Spirochaetota bacterium]